MLGGFLRGRAAVRVAMVLGLVATLLVLAPVTALPAVSQEAGAIVSDPACLANTLPANDDGSTGLVPIGFPLDFGGNDYSELYINNNGNVTFGRPLSWYTPATLPDLDIPVIAPFWADVDTRGGGSQPVQYGYGETVFNGRPALCVNYLNVGFYGYHTELLNSFQLLIVNRNDRALGSFDAVFNYGPIQWETGDASGGSGGFGGAPARAGYATGDGLQGWEVPGSGISRAFLSDNPTGLEHRSLNSGVAGRIILAFNGGLVDQRELNTVPVWNDWHAGDVHAHASGDTSLDIHPKCEGLGEQDCANRLVDNVIDRSARFGTEWVVLTEHSPWLGYQRDSNILYDTEKAERQWNALRQAADQKEGPVRALIGAEVGTASPACSNVQKVGNPLNPLSLQWKSPGHYGDYAGGFVDQSILDCNETGPNGYADDVREAGGWGGPNHPDGPDRGSPWWCWSSKPDGSGAQVQPYGDMKLSDCKTGLDAYGVKDAAETNSFRTMEILSGTQMPSRKVLDSWDMYLQNGYRVSAVGGSDGHTMSREQDQMAAARCVAALRLFFPFKQIGECLDEGSKIALGDQNKVGGSSRTYALYQTGPGGSSTDPVDPRIARSGPTGGSSTDPDDPARLAMRNGQTVASNGPKISAQVSGTLPGSRVSVPHGSKVAMRVDWQDTWESVGDTIGKNNSTVPDGDFHDISGPGEAVDRQVGQKPDRIVIVTGERDGCGWDRFQCAGAVQRKVIKFDDAGNTTAPDVTVHGEQNYADVMVDPPADGFMRAEVYFDVEGGTSDEADDHDDPTKERYYEDLKFDFAAFTSPIYVDRTQTSSAGGWVRDGRTGETLANAPVELCRTVPTPTCVSTTSHADGSFGPISMRSGRWRVRAFPPAGTTGLGVASLDLGDLVADRHRSVELTLPEVAPGSMFIDPSGVVVDTSGQPVAGATVVISKADGINGPFTPLPDGAAELSPANRTNPDTTDAAGQFRWDVIAGWYQVQATKPGCTSAETGPLHIPPPAVDLRLVLDCRPDDETAPEITLTGVPPAFTNQTAVSVQVGLNDASAAGAFCVIDEGPYMDEDGESDSPLPPCGATFEQTGLTEGPHELSVLAIDDRGNISAETAGFTVDTTAPAVTVDGVTDGATVSAGTVVTPSCTAADTLSGLAGSCQGQVTAPLGGGSGTWSYRASATDNAGNATTKVVTWTVAPSAPTCAAAPTVDFVRSADFSHLAARYGVSGVSTTGGALLLAFVEAEGPALGGQRVTSMTGGGLTWTLAARSNKTAGTAEVWQAYAPGALTNVNVTAEMAWKYLDGTITVAAFKGAASQVGAVATASGSVGDPNVTLTPTGCSSLVWAAGQDSSAAASTTMPAGQSVVHRFSDWSVDDTYWVQKLNAAAARNQPVTVRATGSFHGLWAMAAVEIPARNG
jgi:hypothetical protein